MTSTFFYGPPNISTSSAQIKSSISNKQEDLQVAGGSCITFSCKVGTKEQSCIPLEAQRAQICFSSLGLSLQPLPWSRQRGQFLGCVDLNLGHADEMFRLRFVSSHMRNLETHGCLQLSESFSGPTVVIGENWQQSGRDSSEYFRH